MVKIIWVVLTGMRTTGPLHLGHYVGALLNWLRIQEAGEYICYFLLADYQAATTHNDPNLLRRATRLVTLDWLSVGLDPSLSHVHFVLQSGVPERYELSNILLHFASFKEVQRNKTLQTEMETQDFISMSFFNYPADQTGDIYMVTPYPFHPQNKLLIPVGKDQESHLELARNTAVRFNGMRGDLFNPCTPLIGDIGSLPGIEGKKKMGKSAGNAIFLTDSPEIVKAKVMGMYTDPNHLRVEDPGDPDNPVFLYLRAFHPDQTLVQQWADHYAQGGLGDVKVKRELVSALNDHFLPPIRQRRAEVEYADIGAIINEGTMAARAACEPLVTELRQRMGFGLSTLS